MALQFQPLPIAPTWYIIQGRVLPSRRWHIAQPADRLSCATAFALARVLNEKHASEGLQFRAVPSPE